ncbi:MAG TPA: polymer-forming cytoskeletal protein [Vicinamibacterales bacterium]|jgi:cytoskeletal protein CcmA (bactofilin family)|nr:polymer-forming cytoskeletal protein [Vicinamibacterales bacterium]
MATVDAPRDDRTTDSSSPAKPAVEERRVSAWIGQGVVVEGKITSTQDLRIDGAVQGTIEVGRHGLVIGASAAIRANLSARSILISGAVTGNVAATERIDLQPTASVEGDVSAPRVAMADGAVVKGKVEAGGNRVAKPRTGEPEA